MADPSRWRMLLLICLAELGALSLWFSATAVIPALSTPWMSPSSQAWLSMAVTLGFVAGTAISAAFTLVDWIGARWLFCVATVGGALANAALLVWMDVLAVVIICRFLTGLMLAGAYPPGMKLAASWFVAERGFAVGSLVGALTFGTALPHFFNFLGGLAWPPVIAGTSVVALAGAVIMLGFVRDGPHLQGRSPFNPRAVIQLARARGVVLASLGYFGHMWELYAMWTWLGLYLGVAFAQAGVADAPGLASLATAAVIAAGGVGCIVAGRMADRIGRTATTMLAMLGSGACAAGIGFAFGHPTWLVLVALLWGLTVVADSAQFSTAISELAPPQYVGTALSLQTCLGFLLTIVSIRLYPALVALCGWPWSFAFLAPGPFLGTLAMWRLRNLPESRALAGGKR